VTRQETTFTRTISRNQRLQTKTPEKYYVNMASQSECEWCFETYVVIFTYIFKLCWKKNVSVAGF